MPKKEWAIRPAWFGVIKLVRVRFFEGGVEDSLYFFAVIAAKKGDHWIFCRHRDRATFEMPGGRREPGEAIEDTARRELWEETGAVSFTLTPLCGYSVKGKDRYIDNRTETFGMLYYAEVSKLAALPGFEIEEVKLFAHTPPLMTYPSIQPKLMEYVLGYLSGVK